MLVELKPARNSDLIELVVELVLPGRATAPATNLPVSSPNTFEVGFFIFIFFSYFYKNIFIGQILDRGLHRVGLKANQTLGMFLLSFIPFFG